MNGSLNAQQSLDFGTPAAHNSSARDRHIVTIRGQQYISVESLYQRATGNSSLPYYKLVDAAMEHYNIARDLELPSTRISKDGTRATRAYVKLEKEAEVINLLSGYREVVEKQRVALARERGRKVQARIKAGEIPKPATWSKQKLLKPNGSRMTFDELVITLKRIELKLDAVMADLNITI